MARLTKELPALPVERAVKVIAGRWKIVLLFHLIQGPRRLTELGRLVKGLSQKVLIQQLRELEAHGLVRREVQAEVPPRVEYSVTPLGQSLQPIIQALCEWGYRHAEELSESERLADCADVGMAPLPGRKE